MGPWSAGRCTSLAGVYAPKQVSVLAVVPYFVVPGNLSQFAW